MKKWITKDFLLGFMTCMVLILLAGTFNCGRTLSRLGLGDEVLELPKDFQEMISVSFHTGADGKTVKDMTYKTKDGLIKSLEYRDKPWQLEGSIKWVIKD